LAATKRPTRGQDRPLIRSSHGGAATAPPKRAKASKAPRRVSKPATPGAAASPAKARSTEAKKVGKPAVSESRSLSSSGRAATGASTASDAARELAVLIAVAAIEKKAAGLEVIDVSGRVDYADFLVLMSGRSDRHVAALSSSIEDALRKKGKRALAVEGLPHANWVLMDFGDVVVHVFQDDARAAYDIDGLWMDARRLPLPLDEPRA
jgi:ribosome-associated protein